MLEDVLSYYEFILFMCMSALISILFCMVQHLKNELRNVICSMHGK